MSSKKLNTLLAEVAVFNQKVYNLHWNVKGADFMATHKMTEALYEALTEVFDDLAEKVVMQGDAPLANFEGYLAASSIKEVKPRSFTTAEVSDIIVADLNTLQATTDSVEATSVIQPLLDEVYMLIDKQRWLFKSIK